MWCCLEGACGAVGREHVVLWEGSMWCCVEGACGILGREHVVLWVGSMWYCGVGACGAVGREHVVFWGGSMWCCGEGACGAALLAAYLACLSLSSCRDVFCLVLATCNVLHRYPNQIIKRWRVT